MEQRDPGLVDGVQRDVGGGGPGRERHGIGLEEDMYGGGWILVRDELGRQVQTRVRISIVGNRGLAHVARFRASMHPHPTFLGAH